MSFISKTTARMLMISKMIYTPDTTTLPIKSNFAINAISLPSSEFCSASIITL